MNKKMFAVIGGIVIAVGLAMWLLLESVEMAAVYNGEKAAEVFKGLDFLKGIEEGGTKITILSFVAVIAVILGAGAVLCGLGGSKSACGLAIGAAILLFVATLVVPFLGYTSDGKLMMDFVELTGAKIKWGPTTQGYAALAVIAIGGLLSLGSKE